MQQRLLIVHKFPPDDWNCGGGGVGSHWIAAVVFVGSTFVVAVTLAGSDLLPRCCCRWLWWCSLEPSCCGVTGENFEWTVVILLEVVIIGMSGNPLLDGVAVATKVATAAVGNALLLLLLLTSTAALGGEGPVGVTDRVVVMGMTVGLMGVGIRLE